MDKERKERTNKRKIAFVYLMHRMFDGNPTMLLKIMDTGKKVTVEDLQDWDMDYKAAVYQTIQEEDSRGVKLKDMEDVPSIKSIKEGVLRRVNALISVTDDPARLATVYKVLSEFEQTDDKKEKSVLDAINESIKPLSPKKKEMMTMLEKMRAEGKATEPTGKKRGRPKKAVEEQPLIPIEEDKPVEVDTEEEIEEQEED